jgi:hypothetical protein
LKYGSLKDAFLYAGWPISQRPQKKAEAPSLGPWPA